MMGSSLEKLDETKNIQIMILVSCVIKTVNMMNSSFSDNVSKPILSIRYSFKFLIAIFMPITNKEIIKVVAFKAYCLKT